MSIGGRGWFWQVGDFPGGFVCSGVGFRACGAPYFLLLRQKKVSKEKATLVDAPLRGVPCATRFGRGHPKSTSSRCCASLRALRNSGPRPSDSPRPLPPPTCVAQRLTRGPKGVMERPAACFSKRCAGSAGWVRAGFPRPVDSAEQRRVAQGTRAAGADAGSYSFCLLFLGEARKSKARLKRKKQPPNT